MVGVDRRSVRRWKAAFRKRGRAAIAARPACGRPPQLSPSLIRRWERALLRGAQAAGFPTDLWTCPRVAQLIAQRFHIRYHVDHLGRLLHALGWSPQKPARRAVERDEEAIRGWVKQTWPALKKSPPAERLADFPRRMRLSHGAVGSPQLAAPRPDTRGGPAGATSGKGIGPRRLGRVSASLLMPRLSVSGWWGPRVPMIKTTRSVTESR